MDQQDHLINQQTATPGHGSPLTESRRYGRPRTNITETPANFLVQVEMPGVNRQNLDITFEHGELSLLGRRNPAPGSESAELVYRESRPEDFRRVFELDSSIDTTRITAELAQGLLTLTLPKAEAAKPRRIEINGLS